MVYTARNVQLELIRMLLDLIKLCVVFVQLEIFPTVLYTSLFEVLFLYEKHWAVYDLELNNFDYLFLDRWCCGSSLSISMRFG